MSTLQICPGMDKPHEGQEDLLDRSLIHHQEFMIFANPWIDRASEAYRRNDSFKGLIYLWIVFNSWVSQVVIERDYAEKDWYLVQAAGRDEKLCSRFETFLENDEELLRHSKQFRELWPVFKVRALQDLHITPWNQRDNNRNEYRNMCFSYDDLRKWDYSPSCVREHQERGQPFSPENIPLDWAHVLQAIYQVRCNLFHGGKTFSNSSDIIFVKLSFRILWKVWGNPIRNNTL